MNTPIPKESEILVKVREAKESTRRIPNPDGPDPVLGKFWFIIDIKAPVRDLYVPVSIASGKKPTGFSYQIEGTVPGAIKSTDIECRGEGITQITHGTILYCKIPAGLTATFKIRVEMRGALSKAYRILIYQIQYKHNPTDARYQKLPQDIRSKMQKFS